MAPVQRVRLHLPLHFHQYQTAFREDLFFSQPVHRALQGWEMAEQVMNQAGLRGVSSLASPLDWAPYPAWRAP